MDNCEEMLALISAQLDGALTPSEQAQLQQHLEHCADCRALATELSALHRALLQMTQPAPAGFTDQVMTRIRKEEGAVSTIRFPKSKAVPTSWKKWGGLAAGLVATVAIVVVGTGLPNSNSDYGATTAMFSDDTAMAAPQSNSLLEDAGSSPATGATAVEDPSDIEFTDEYNAALWEQIGELQDHIVIIEPEVEQVVLSDLTELEALSILATHIYGSSQYSFKFNETKLTCYASVEENGRLADEGTIIFDGISPNELYYMFHWTWPYQVEEDAQLYQYSVSRVDSHILWLGDVLDDGTSYFNALI